VYGVNVAKRVSWLVNQSCQLESEPTSNKENAPVSWTLPGLAKLLVSVTEPLRAMLIEKLGLEEWAKDAAAPGQ
jgi:hypothetical protein